MKFPLKWAPVLFLQVTCFTQIMAQAEPEFRLGTGDVLQILMPARSDLSGKAVVSAGGYIRLPLLGQVEAANRTPSELGNLLLERYNIFDPSISDVTVTVVEVHSQSVSILGEVRDPGIYPFRTIPDVWNLLLYAGGPTSEADLTRVRVVRKRPEEGKPRSIFLDLSESVEGVEPNTLPKLRSGDSVVIPSKVEAINGKQIQILGSVHAPGRYGTRSAKTVVEALSVSGGPLSNATLKSARLTRRTDKGVIVYHLDLHGYLNDGHPMADLRLKPGDTLLVPKKGGFGSVLSGMLLYIPVLTAVTGLVIVLNQ